MPRPRRIAATTALWILLGIAAAPGASSGATDRREDPTPGTSHCARAQGEASPKADDGYGAVPEPDRVPCQWVTPLRCCDQPSTVGSEAGLVPDCAAGALVLREEVPVVAPPRSAPSRPWQVPRAPLGVVLRI